MAHGSSYLGRLLTYFSFARDFRREVSWVLSFPARAPSGSCHRTPDLEGQYTTFILQVQMLGTLIISCYLLKWWKYICCTCRQFDIILIKYKSLLGLYIFPMQFFTSNFMFSCGFFLTTNALYNIRVAFQIICFGRFFSRSK